MVEVTSILVLLGAIAYLAFYIIKIRNERRKAQAFEAQQRNAARDPSPPKVTEISNRSIIQKSGRDSNYIERRD